MEFEVVEDVGSARDLLTIYETYPWWEDRDHENLERALEHTDLFVGFRDGLEDLVAAARVLTDFTYYGRVYDVIVTEQHRGEGIGERLMETVTAYPDLEGVDVLTLDCREGLVPFYERCGFERREPTTTVAGEEEKLVRMRFGREEEADPSN